MKQHPRPRGGHAAWRGGRCVPEGDSWPPRPHGHHGAASKEPWLLCSSPPSTFSASVHAQVAAERLPQPPAWGPGATKGRRSVGEGQGLAAAHIPHQAGVGVVGGRWGAVGPRDQGLGAVAAVHLAVGRQGVAVAGQHPGACQESGGTVGGKAQPRGSGGQWRGPPGSCFLPWARAAGGREGGRGAAPGAPRAGLKRADVSGARPSIRASPAHPGPHCHSPMGPRLGPAAALCGGGWPTSWLTGGSLLTPPCTLVMGERTGP